MLATKTLSLCSKGRVRATSESKNDNEEQDAASLKGLRGMPGATGSMIGFENYWPAYSCKRSLISLQQMDQTPYKIDEKELENI